MTMLIKAVVFDIDGVLTDGKVSVDEEGHERKSFSLSEIDFVHRMKRDGLRIAAITGEDTPLAQYFQRRIPWDFFVMGCKEKGMALEDVSRNLKVDLGEIVYIGDGYYDIPALKLAGLGVCPANATSEAKEAADVVLSRCGGDGAISELYQLVRGQNSAGKADNEVLAILERLISRYPALEKIREELLAAYQSMEAAYQKGNKVLIAGNGGYATDSVHRRGADEKF